MGNKIPIFRKGKVITADALNQVGRAIVRNVRAGPGVQIVRANQEVVVSADVQGRRFPRQMLIATIATEIGGGVYTWTKFKGEGPETGTAASTGVPDRTANEVNGETGIAVGKKIALFRIAGVWYFQKPSSTVSGTSTVYLTGYPGPQNDWQDWGLATGSGATLSAPGINQRQAGAAFSGDWAGAATQQINSNNFAGPFPNAKTGCSWFSKPLSPNFPGFGSGGIVVRHRLAHVSGSGAVYKITVGIYTKTASNTAHGTIFIDRTGVTGDAAGVYTNITIPKALLGSYFQPGDQIGLYINCTQTAGNVAGIDTLLISGVRGDLTGV